MQQDQRLVAERYELESTIGHGGMGRVWCARDRVLGRSVAVKLLAPELASDERFVARFVREARAAASLSHEHVVTVYDAGSDDGTHYIVMELVEGPTLAEILRNEGALPPERAAGIAAQVCRALGAAHARGIVHRDVKPGNIMLTVAGGVKVMDFGIARAAASETITQTASLLGTAAYLSPETVEGEEADARSDLYSLGVVVFEMLTGRVPFTGATAVVVAQQHVRAKPQPPRALNPAIPPTLEEVVLRAMAKSPRHRFGDAAAMESALLRAIAGPASETGGHAPDSRTQVIRRDPTEPLAAVPARRARTRGAVPLSVRLLATYSLIVAATLLVVATLAVRLTRTHLAHEIDARLAAAARSFHDGPAARVERPEDLAPEARDWLSLSPFPDDQVAAVRVGTEAVLTSTGGIDLRSVRGGRRLLESTSARWWDLRGPQGNIRALTVPLVLRGSQAGTLVVAASRSRAEDTLAGLRSGIAWSAFAGLLFAGLLGFAVVSRTLRPLRRMSGEVEVIKSTGDLTRRVTHRGPADEVGTLAEEFNRLLDQLEHAFARQRSFLSDASHELRTPLTVARGQLELLQDAVRTAEGKRSLGVATGELDRMARIVEDLLLLARLDEGLRLELEPVEVELVLREALLRGMIGPRPVDVSAEEGLLAMADPARLLQVLTNLVTNAVRHADEDAHITLSARRDEKVVLVEVSDTGPGIPASDLQHVFERFYRGAGARVREDGGAGLGLPIAASLVRAMGGDIAVRSAPGAGTSFTVSLVPAA